MWDQEALPSGKMPWGIAFSAIDYHRLSLHIDVQRVSDIKTLTYDISIRKEGGMEERNADAIADTVCVTLPLLTQVRKFSLGN
ncbi:hypothetical protein DSBG_3489 [Desulfosporosinus sp. BG]|nr:hypothetical protein DSBG_3489 [Desulfosporosinus sp. BG]